MWILGFQISYVPCRTKKTHHLVIASRRPGPAQYLSIWVHGGALVYHIYRQWAARRPACIYCSAPKHHHPPQPLTATQLGYVMECITFRALAHNFFGNAQLLLKLFAVSSVPSRSAVCVHNSAQALLHATKQIQQQPSITAQLVPFLVGDCHQTLHGLGVTGSHSLL